jgi:DNA transformation protein and related proteins
MAVSESFLEFVRDQLAPAGDIVIRKMFGGAGIYCDGAMFGLVLSETLYFRTDAASAAQFEDAGCKQFIYERPPCKPVAMPYWVVPEHLFEDADEMLVWAREAIAVARREKCAKDEKAARRASGPAKPAKPSSKRRPVKRR